MKQTILVIIILGIVGLSVTFHEPEPEWIALFNGKDLTGWQPKIKGHELGDNFGNTFRVEDGLLTVSYDAYDAFGERYGHLFFEEKFSRYLLRVEYRFIGRQVAGGEGWAYKNSGVMIHCQSPQSMAKDQDFPISLEVQLLGGNGREERPTGNLCTPGTHVMMEGELQEKHCITADAPTYDGEEWVTMDIWVWGGERIAHIIEGDTVIRYTRPAIGGGVVNDYHPWAKTDGKPLKEGYISLQSESHPIQFRKVLLKDLSGE